MRNNIEINVQIMKHDKLPDILKLFEAILWHPPSLKNEKYVIYTWNLQQIYEEELYPEIMTTK